MPATFCLVDVMVGHQNSVVAEGLVFKRDYRLEWEKEQKVCVPKQDGQSTDIQILTDMLRWKGNFLIVGGEREKKGRTVS